MLLRVVKFMTGVVLLLCVGCVRHKAPPATRPATPAAPSVYTNAAGGIQLTLPSQWERRANQDYVLALAPTGATSDDQGSITLDIPKLPPHIRGLIPIGSVRGGYVDDLRQQFHDLKTQDLAPPTVPDAKVRLVRSTGQASGKQLVEIALLLVHDDHVYILRGRSDATNESKTRLMFDQIVQSLRWLSAQASTRSADAR